MPPPPVGIIGGTGLYAFLSDAHRMSVRTPFGEHSEGLTRGRVEGREVVFIPRHGLGHRLAPHTINYRANLWALAGLGVEQVLAPCAVGSLQPHLVPGSIVVPDQLVDLTRQRRQSFVDEGMFHVAFADPYCPVIRETLLRAAKRDAAPATAGGVMVVIEGPRFSTRAESLAHSRAGYSVINMTGMPEAVLARELAMCYATLALVTDFDAGTTHDDAVTQSKAVETFARGVDSLRQVLASAVLLLPHERSCSCASSLDGLPQDHLPVR
jgi:5'-methylthioadenosine phosphorylase